MRPQKINNREGQAYCGGKKIEGKYANFFKVGYNAFEFVMDFGQFYPGTDEAELSVRVITSPFYAKAFLTTLKESMAAYERTYGAIEKDEAL
jgi:hypothetical protein